MNVVLEFVRRIGIGLALILVASAILLFSDPRRQRDHQEGAILKIAIVNYASVPVLEDGERGLVDGLAEHGYVEGRNVELHRFNAEGDRPNAIMMAREVLGRDFDLVLTLSTPVLQAVANANTSERRTHVFTLTTDPWGAGIGIDRDDPSSHPPYMTGHGTLQPVREVFDLAREANPELRRVGVVWNPSESNSEASTRMARAACAELGIDLVEGTVESSTAVLESARAVVARDVEAIWVGGDSTVATALDALVGVANDAGIPVFGNMPGDVKRGVTFALGADYYEVGRASGALAARVLRGESPAAIPVENYVPRELAVNLVAARGVGDSWALPADWTKRARIVVDASGVHEERRTSVVRRPEPGREYVVAIVHFAPDAVTDATIDGLKRRLAERGFVEGENVRYAIQHAQGDLATIPALMQGVDQSEADLLVSLTTPCLTAACSMVSNKPVVFTEVYDPIAAGAGKSFDDHRENVTGVGSFPPLEKMLDAMQELVPGLKSIGIVYNDAEANSRKVVGVARKLCEKRGLVLREATVTNTSEVLQAAQVLVQQDVQVLWEVGDNTVNQGLEALVKAGRGAGVPVVNSDADSASRGSVVGVGISFEESGYAAGELAARVLLGESPARIPFEEVAVVRLGANLAAAKDVGVRLSPEFLKECEVFHGVRAKYGRPANVAFVQLAGGPSLDRAAAGVLEGLAAAGLVLEDDVTVRKYDAQGDLSQLPQILQSILDGDADLIVTSTTPAMIAAAGSTETTPIVFTVASDPAAVGVVPEGQRRPNVVGVYDNPPIASLLDLARRREGRVEKVGTVWNPAEPNSRISFERLREACRKRDIELVEQHAANVTELLDTTQALCVDGIDVLVISADNVTSSGISAIVSVTRKHDVPIYCTEPDLVEKGAAAAIGVDFAEWGRQSAHLATKVLAGVPPAELELEEVHSIRTVLGTE